MTGALMQLVAYGAQDIYLTGNPMITYFKVVYHRHTNFAMESIQQTFSGLPGFGRSVSSIISRNGDLLTGLLLELTVPALTAGAWVHDIGNYLVKQVELEIGGQLIDHHYGDWLEIWSQLTVTSSQRLGYNQMIGEGLVSSTGDYTGLQATGNHDAKKLMVPLQFWFCRNVGLALPLIALQYHEVKINLTFSTLASVLVSGGTITGDLKCDLYADYIYLDTDERRRFAQVSHEYLIEQVQFNGEESYPGGGRTVSYPLSLNHPVKELIWACQDTSNKVNLDAVKIIGGAGNDVVYRSYIDSTGHIYICGSSTSTTLNGVTRPVGVESSYIAKLAKDYTVIWHRWLIVNNTVTDIKLDNNGNVYCYGNSFGGATMTINGVAYTRPVAGGNSDVYAIKFNTDGNVLWFKWIVGTGTDYVSGRNISKFSMDNDNNMYFAVGTTSNPCTLVNLNAAGVEVDAGTRIVSINVFDAVNVGGIIYKIAENGTVSWYGEVNNAQPWDCIITSDGALLVSGTKNNADAGGQTTLVIREANGTQLLNTGFTLVGAAAGVGWCMKITLAGNAMTWFRGFTGGRLITTACADNQGNVIVGGLRSANPANEIVIQDGAGAAIANGNLAFRGAQTGFVVKLNAAGAPVFNVYLGQEMIDAQCDEDNNILLTTWNIGGTLTLTSSGNVKLYETTTATTGNTHIVALTGAGLFQYAKEFSVTALMYLALFIVKKSVYAVGTQNNTAVLTVTNNATATETYNYPVALAGRNGFIYRYNVDLTYNSPDPYSVGTALTGADNFSTFIGGKNPVSSAILKLNGNDRFAQRTGDYFNLVQTYNHHTCIPKSRGINVYSFALRPEEHQPSGSCNFSRIDNSRLELTYRPELTGGVMKLYAVNYNVLRVMSGMGGLAYSN